MAIRRRRLLAPQSNRIRVGLRLGALHSRLDLNQKRVRQMVLPIGPWRTRPTRRKLTTASGVSELSPHCGVTAVLDLDPELLAAAAVRPIAML